ncbi:MAG: isoprenylcysteine carboxylmethyltransferase family protein [Candidatus Micrarchaeota archaeon]
MKEKMDISKLKGKSLLMFGLAIIVFAAIFFIPAGTLDYWHGWLYMGVILIPMVFVVDYFFKHDPALLESRFRMKEKEREQKNVVKYGSLLYLLIFLIPGLDYRFGWSHVPAEAAIISNAVVLLSYISVFMVMKENSYLSRIVEIQKGQKVISTGPYAVVRHPMYTGVLMMFIASPLALGSYWALIPVAPIVPLIVYRLLNEEKVLLKGLRGYKEYCKKVRYRLVPFVW